MRRVSKNSPLIVTLIENMYLIDLSDPLKTPILKIILKP